MNLEQTVVIQRQAKAAGIDPSMLAAIVQVESSGRALVPVGAEMLPEIRWEGHYFDQYVPASLQEEARKLGLAHPKAQKIKNPKSQEDRYKILYRAMQLDQTAALMSISMGIGQVMGANATKLGYASPSEMFNQAKLGYEAQVEMMVKYLFAFDLDDEVARKDFRGLARGWNGQNYKKFAYDTKLQAAYEALSGKTPVSKADRMLRMGSEGRDVSELQSLLVRAGYSLKVDSDFGPNTKEALKAFQLASKLTVDGVAGPETMKALATFRQEGEDLTKPNLRKTFDGLVVAVGGATGIETAKNVVEVAAKQVTGYGLPEIVGTGLLWIAGILVVVGLGVSAYQYLKALKRA